MWGWPVPTRSQVWAPTPVATRLPSPPPQASAPTLGGADGLCYGHFNGSNYHINHHGGDEQLPGPVKWNIL